MVKPMVTSDGYFIMQIPKDNKIIISIPQTPETTTTTSSTVVNRKIALTVEEEVVLLSIVSKKIDVLNRRSQDNRE